MLKMDWKRLAKPGEGGAVFGVVTSRPSGPTTKLNVDVAVAGGLSTLSSR
jgi:hypothetical protein